MRFNLAKKLVINKHEQEGFTMVELIVVIVVIAIIATFMFVSYRGVNRQATIAALESDLSSAARSIKLFQVDNEAYPTAVNDCPTPSTGKLCLKFNTNTVISYSYNNNSNPQTFQLTATNAGVTYYIDNSMRPIEQTSIALTGIAGISGTAKVGQVLTAGALTPSGATVSYQWQIASTSGGAYSNIAGATFSQYTPVTGDVGKYIKVTASGTGDYSGTVISAPTAAVQSASTVVTVNGSAFTNNNPYDSGTWWGADYTGDFGDTKWETTSTFNLGSYSNGTITSVTLNWSYSSTGQGNGGRNRYIVAASPRSTLYTASTINFPNSYSGSNLTTYVNSKKGTTCQINWEADYGDEGLDIWGIEVGMSNPRLTFTFTPN